MVNWIMACVSTLSYSICINGERHRYFRGGRGLRKRDPISPYLFTIVREVFNLVLKQKISEETMFKYYFGCKKLQITHLCFADDLLVLCHGDSTSVKVIKSALEDFSKVSGLYPNLGKALFSVEAWTRIPLLLGVKDCKGLIDKIKTRIHDWKNKSLSYTGRAQGELQKGKAKVDWKENLWNVANKRDTLWVRWIHLIKLKGQSVWEIEKQCNDSCLWKDLMDLKVGVRKHMQYKIGNGCTISMWHESWTMMPPLDTVISRRMIYASGFSNDTLVFDCIDKNGWKWPAKWFTDHPILNQYLVPVLNTNMVDNENRSFTSFLVMPPIRAPLFYGWDPMKDRIDATLALFYSVRDVEG
ncbi:RNA-directed DNA polymerase, eukaryota, reverse transcriptase zinc-binding domain protein [Tanacetum coccineum]